MRTISEELAAHLALATRTTCTCWQITPKYGNSLTITDHTEDVRIDAPGVHLTFTAGGGLVPGAAALARSVEQAASQFVLFLSDDSSPAREEVRAGSFDGSMVTAYLVNYESPGDGVVILLSNYRFGSISMGDWTLTPQIENMGQKLSNPVTRTYSKTCRAELGDAECTVDLADYRESGSVSEIVSTRPKDRFFVVPPPSPMDDNFNRGRISWTSGDNYGSSVQVAGFDKITNLVSLESPTPHPIQVGDSFIIYFGCDKTIETCQARFANEINFQGEPYLPLDTTIFMNRRPSDSRV